MLLSEKLAALQQLKATLHVATSTSAANTKTIDDMSLWRNTSQPDPAEIETLRAEIDKLEKELGS